MKSITCDVLVVGAGPAGSSAARSSAIQGLKTILIEKKTDAGVDVKCGEGIGAFLLPHLPFDIPKKQLIWKIDGIDFWTDDILVKRQGEFWKGYSIDRKIFDKWLSSLAVKSGATLWTNTKLVSLTLDEEYNVKKALVKKNSKEITVIPKILIAADGSESDVLKLMNIYKPKVGDHAEVYSWEMKNLDLIEPHYEQIFTGDFTPSGYAYIFPKSKNIANIGIGGVYPEKDMEKYFEEFLEIGRVKKQVKNADFIKEKSKKAIWSDIAERWIYGNVYIVGDAANQNLKPFIEGILPSIICGDIAGKFADYGVSKKELNNSNYYDAVCTALSPHFSVSKELQEGIGYLFKKKEKEKYLQFFGLVTELIDLDKLSDTENITYDKLKLKIINQLD